MSDPQGPRPEPQATLEQLFRREHGRLVAALVRRVGVHRLDLVEDAVQAAMLSALATWSRSPPPERPGAWLHRVAFNHLLGTLRQETGRARLLATQLPEDDGPDAPNDPHFSNEVSDDLLRMLFVCGDPRLPRESQLVLALKVLCGFSVEEIAARLLTTTANVYKRLHRGREELAAGPTELDALTPEELAARRPSVAAAIYVMFNEGYLSAHPDQSIRRELCDEAIRLATLLAESPIGAGPETAALVALFHLHAARFDARIDSAGGLVLLEEQDRRLWDRRHLGLGARWLERAAAGGELTRYHLEAAIAVEHVSAPSYAETRWAQIAELYAALIQIDPSPFHLLHRAVALAQAEGPEVGLTALEGLTPPGWLEGHYLWAAVMSELHRRAGHLDRARHHRQLALEGAPSEPIRAVLARRLADGSAEGGS